MNMYKIVYVSDFVFLNLGRWVPSIAVTSLHGW